MDAVTTENVERPHGKSKSCIKLFLTVTTIFLLVATIIFIGLFLYYYIQFDKNDTPTDSSICTTPVCVSTAALMLKNMNLSVDPCVDFNEFACGRYNREAPIPEGSSHADKLVSKIIQENDLVMKDIITEEIATGQPKYLEKMKLFYKSCMDTETIEDTPLLTIVNRNYRQDWPTLNPNWSNSSFNLNDLIIRYASEYTAPLFNISVDTHKLDTTRNVIYVETPTILLNKQDLMSEMAVVLGANRTTAKEDAEEFQELAKALSETPAETRLEVVLLGSLSTRYPWVDLPGVIRAVFETVNITLSDDSDVIISCLEYMKRLNVTLNKFSNRAIQNYFGFSYALSRVEDMRYSLRQKAFPETRRWKMCLDRSSKYFWKAMSKQFVARKFSNETKVSVEKIIDNLKNVFKQILGEITWLESSTKTAALKKLDAMTSKIGYPDIDFTDEDINQEYEQFDMDENTYYRNERLILEILRKKELSSIFKPVDKTEWDGITPIETNAGMQNLQNSIAFPAAFLQPPNFSPTYPDAINYGFMGVVIGHEIIHGFDPNGRDFDDKGNRANWWQPSDTTKFLDKVQCIVDQASQFKFDEVNMTLNGELVKGEATSDNGGLKLSYRAYKAFAAKKGENKSLPGLNLNYDQLFFLAFGQNWCQRFTLDGLKELLQNEHPLGRFRIIGTLQNSEEFAKAYNCPRGSKMNPVKKCSVW